MGDYEMLEQLTKNIREWVFKSEKAVIIGVSGHGAAGKTTFVSELIEQFEPHKVNYINTDPYIVEIRQFVKKRLFSIHMKMNPIHLK